MKPIAVLLLMGLIITGCAPMTVTNGVPNLAYVGDNIWRGGQPTSEGWAFLHKLGIKTVIKLNEEREGSDADAVNFGMQMAYAPVSLAQQMGLKPMPHGFETGFIPNSNPLFIHCSHGQDRTGVFVAMYRARSGWSKADAEKEMLAHGFHKELVGLWNFWKDWKP